MQCDLVRCQSGENAINEVVEHVHDGQHTADICDTCLDLLKIKPGDDLPSSTNNLLNKHYKVPGAWKVGDPIKTGPYKHAGTAGNAKSGKAKS